MTRQLEEELLLLREEAFKRRSSDPWWTWEPSDKQELFIRAILEDGAEESWMFAANRCITPWAVLETGSATRRIEELIGEAGFDVKSWDGGSRCTRQASPLFLKGIEPAFRFLLDNGQVFEATCKHQVLTSVGWFSLENLVSKSGGLYSKRKFEGCQESFGKDGRSHDQQLRIPKDIDIAGLPPAIGALVRTLKGHALVGVMAPTLECIRSYLQSAPLTNLDDQNQIAALCALWKTPSSGTSDQLRTCLFASGLQPVAGLGLVKEAPLSLDLAPEDVPGGVYVLPFPVPLSGGAKLLAYQEIGLQPILDFTVEGTHCYEMGGAIHHNSGKTDAAAFAGASLARFGRKCPRFQITDGGAMVIEDYATSGWVVSLDFPNSRDVVQPKLFDNGFGRDPSHAPFIPAHEIKSWSVTNQILQLKNGSIIGFKSADSGTVKFAGAAKDWVMFDEEPPRPIYEESVIRVGGGQRSLQVFGACTLLPSEGQIGGVSWMFQEKIRPWQAGKSVPWGIFQASIYDNPHLNRKEIARLEALYPEGSIQRAIRLYGELRPGLSGARAYPSFDGRLHSREQGDVMQRRPLCWMWDFNVEPLVSLIGQRHGNVFKVYREIVLDEGNIAEMCQAFREAYPTHMGEIWIYGDASGTHRHVGTGKSEYKTIFNHMVTYGSPIRMRVPEANPAISARVNAVQYQLRDETGMPHIEIDPSCIELIADLEGVLLDTRGGIKKTHNRKDPYSRRTHTSDAFGYWIAYEEPVKMIRPEYGRQVQNTIRSPSYAFNNVRKS